MSHALMKSAQVLYQRKLSELQRLQDISHVN